MNNLKYFIYGRKSTDDSGRQVASIAAQLEELRRIAAHDNFEIIEEITESQSAKQPGRPLFNRMLHEIAAGKAQGILTWKIDRLARNPIDEGQIKWMLQEGKIKHIRTSERDFYPGDNVVVLGVDFAVATQYIIDLKSNVKRGMKHKVERGWLPGLAPMGYINRQIRKGEHDIVPDPDRFDLVKRLWHDLIYHHHPLSKVYETAMNEMALRSRSGKKLSMSQFYKMFENPFYYGYFRFNKQVHKGNHPAMISRQEFDIAQEILHHRHHPRQKVHNFAFTGLLRCGECGSMFTAEEKVKTNRKGEVRHYTYYRCTRSQNKACRARPINEKELDKQIESLLAHIEISPGMREAILEVLSKESTGQRQYFEQQMKTRQKEFDKCVNSLNRLLRMNIRGEISEEEYNPLRKELQEEKATLLDLLQDTSQQVDGCFEKMDALLTFASSARGMYPNADSDFKKQVLLSLGQNLTIKNGTLCLSKNSVLFGVSDFSIEEKLRKRPIEPVKLLKNQQLTQKVKKWSG
ncbi:MAG: hypothetical protein A2509_07550 [Candidatus Edwardsbacteria bacterium RIFOXYD12_FULL_50_11]|uniref:Recombinase domain-containing protein n=1 Tax=Candidatus Edwardsbacteria bacterium GWF2_54_11 TaxID=1817851 RepID=A0A1F5RE11_9BACT|nr:MAG: hypothetical protein A2502_00425 [Candidatus Edwardsbacteria bacterium RifOxyC12_full_54_24]OGF06087.1 MAG: hypothetical protein A2273_09895 [Candidatus Edwardsbacteria bacterium RifOxyA12_full_54_48]OGF12669.1 MAG: hypothetical protein A2024_00360 [Candidatus Edwardsbacteria bacterium GWF2_54_11]OGF17128.1 MAG: hypothetical protein A2509_07550 [Candidatus Edwardsbacteria bacterium RIFOXYD12_FULL_50_11]OGJ18327.1 MAG: hypothetical protein A2349_11740 [Candidatus Edwardsbacteria bacteriu